MSKNQEAKCACSGKGYDYLVTCSCVASAVITILLLLAKIYVLFVTGSSTMLASLSDSVMDLCVSLVNLFAVRYALMPPDREHAYGHGKAESLAGLMQSAFICGTAVLLILHGSECVVTPRKVENLSFGIWITVATIVITLLLVLFQIYVVRRTGSQVVNADSFHYRLDVLLNVGVLGSFAVMKYYPSLDFVDGVSTILIGLYIIYGASKIGYEAIQMLLDSAISPEDQQRIFDIAVREKDVINIHDLRTRQSGRIKIIQLHATMDSAMSLLRAHNAADRIEKSIREAFPDADVTVHMEPLEVQRG